MYKNELSQGNVHSQLMHLLMLTVCSYYSACLTLTHVASASCIAAYICLPASPAQQMRRNSAPAVSAAFLRRLPGAPRSRLPQPLIGSRSSAGTNHQRLYDFWASLGSLMCGQRGRRSVVFDTATGVKIERSGVIKMTDAWTPNARRQRQQHVFILSSATRRHFLYTLAVHVAHARTARGASTSPHCSARQGITSFYPHGLYYTRTVKHARRHQSFHVTTYINQPTPRGSLN